MLESEQNTKNCWNLSGEAVSAKQNRHSIAKSASDSIAGGFSLPLSSPPSSYMYVHVAEQTGSIWNRTMCCDVRCVTY